MRITRLNPEWQWNKWSNANVVNGEQTQEKLTLRKYRPVAQNPAPQYSLSDFYIKMQDLEFRDDWIQKWLVSYGPLDNIHSDSASVFKSSFNAEAFLEEAHHVWWVTSVLDEFRKQKIDPSTITKAKAIGDELTVKNPMYGRESGKLLYPYGYVDADYFSARKQASSDKVKKTDADWSTTHSVLLKHVLQTINYYLKHNTFVSNELNPDDGLPWRKTRDLYGRRNKKTASWDTYISVSTVAEPKNLSGYMWLRNQEQLSELPHFYYYNCQQFFTPIDGQECWTYLKREIKDNICKHCGSPLAEKDLLRYRPDRQGQLNEIDSERLGGTVVEDKHRQLVDEAGNATCPANRKDGSHNDSRSRRIWCSEACKQRARRTWLNRI